LEMPKIGPKEKNYNFLYNNRLRLARTWCDR
jgi:hypothetical protein